MLFRSNGSLPSNGWNDTSPAPSWSNMTIVNTRRLRRQYCRWCVSHYVKPLEAHTNSEFYDYNDFILLVEKICLCRRLDTRDLRLCPPNTSGPILARTQCVFLGHKRNSFSEKIVFFALAWTQAGHKYSKLAFVSFV